ncbi:chromosome partitioning protein, partial [Yersinia pestis subsp. pestis]
KMKKGDAAAHAEHFMQHTRWVPAWLKGPEPAAESGADDAVSDTDSTDNDTTNTAHAA